MGLRFEPSSEPLYISADQLFLNRGSRTCRNVDLGFSIKQRGMVSSIVALLLQSERLHDFPFQKLKEESSFSCAAVERIWHMKDSRGKILDLAFRLKSLKPIGSFPFSSKEVFAERGFAKPRNAPMFSHPGVGLV